MQSVGVVVRDRGAVCISCDTGRGHRQRSANQSRPLPNPPLLFFLFLIIELNGIKSFSIGIFLCSHPFEQPEGDFNMLLPFDTAAVLEVEELRGI